MTFSNPKRLREKIVYYIFLLALLLIIMVALDRSGLLMFFYLIFMPLGIVGVFWITKIIFKKWYLSLLASAIAVALIVYDLRAPHIRMAHYCEEYNAGVHIYETAENVDGFYAASDYIGCDSICIDGLLHYKYEYVEAKLDGKAFNDYVAIMSKGKRKIEKKAWKYSTFATQPGYYRFYILPTEDDPRCEYSNRWLELYYKERYENGLGRLDKYRGLCVATEKIETPESKYEVIQVHYKETVGKDLLSRSHKKIIDRETGNVLAEKNGVGFKPDMFFYAHETLTHPKCFDKFIFLNVADVLHN